MKMNIKLVTFVVATCLLCASEVNGQSLEINTPAEWTTTGTLPSSVREIAGVKLSVDTLDGIQKRFGTAKRFRIDKGEAADDFLCYESKSHKFLILGSGPMGGWTTLTSIAYGVTPPSGVRENCAASVFDFDKRAKSAWLTNLPALEKTVRKKTKTTADGFHHVRFEREVKTRQGGNENMYCSSGVRALAKKSSVIEFAQIWESCSK